MKKFKDEKYGESKDEKVRDNRGKKRRPSRKRSPKEKAPTKKDIFSNGEGISYAGTGNDPRWYAASDALLRDSASLPYSTSLGLNVALSNNSIQTVYTGLTNRNEEFHVSGVCAINYMPGPGISNDNASAVNVAARNLYSFVTHAQSGGKNYEAPDLMMYILGMASIYNMWNFLVRIYGVAMTYNQKNRYMPGAILTAMNVDPDDVIRNLPILRYFINNLANKVGVMCVPTTLPIIERHCFMNQQIYLDAPDEKAQIYFYTPQGYYQWVENAGTPGYLEFNDLWDTNGIQWTVSGLIGAITQQVDAMALSEDCNRMSGDIMKAYDGHVWKLEPIPLEYVVIPQYNEEILSQIENCIALGDPKAVDAASKAARNITQNGTTGAIEYSPWFTVRPYVWMDKLINMHHDEVTPADNMVATRLMNIPFTSEITYVDGTYDHDGMELQSSGSEIVTHFTVVTITQTPTFGYVLDTYDSFPTFANTSPGALAMSDFVTKISKFDWHPIFYLVIGTSAQTMVTTQFRGILGDLDNYTSVDATLLKMMHDTAILSEFNVPLMGATVTSMRRG